ncbi:MAG: SUMF1/EgtB/PvdO family nonheme iron enzyme [Fuerstiella sp.]|nr:SUMF1/EgtB/PvdO family nonheme iron enzyme [Fuerstiella sp.]
MIRRTVLCVTLLLFAGSALPLVLEPHKDSRHAVAAQADTKSEGVIPTDSVHQDVGDFKQAGVCARCHVVSVLEWGISEHVTAETDCRTCHGESRGHVKNERNQVKPDRLPRGDAIARQICANCHESGCPNTLQTQNCQQCHHVHALINPSLPPTETSSQLEQLLSRWKQFESRMEEAEQHVRGHDFQAAQSVYSKALELIPGNHSAQSGLEMCLRRMNPSLQGFMTVSNDIDSTTGLPIQVRVDKPDVSMQLVPGGEFDIGSDTVVDSRPVHTVRISPFYLGRYEITQSQWREVMGNNPSVHQGPDFPEADQMPVEHVSWNDCQEFLRRLNSRVSGAGFRLPTEAEWEYACLSGAAATRAVSDSAGPPGRYAWFRSNSKRLSQPDQAFLEIGVYAPRPVGMKQPNAWSFHDMRGNVAEWCSSLFRPYLYDANDGRESMSVEGKRVVRGGGFADSATSLDPARRHSERPHRRFRWNGLRLARDVPNLPRRKSVTSQ